MNVWIKELLKNLDGHLEENKKLKLWKHAGRNVHLLISQIKGC